MQKIALSKKKFGPTNFWSKQIFGQNRFLVQKHFGPIFIVLLNFGKRYLCQKNFGKFFFVKKILVEKIVCQKIFFQKHSGPKKFRS